MCAERKMEKEYDVLVVGPVSLDHNIDYLGNERSEVGGAVVASGWAAAGSGAMAAIFCKLNPEEADVNERFAGINVERYVQFLAHLNIKLFDFVVTKDIKAHATRILVVCFDDIFLYLPFVAVPRCTAFRFQNRNHSSC